MNTISKSLKEKHISMEGCSQDEIKKVEDYYGVTLPKAYIEFLSIMGKGAGPFMRGTDVFYDSIFQLNMWKDEMTKELGYKLPEKSFVFWIHHGYMLCYFICNGIDDPAVFLLSEMAEGYKLTQYESFTEFLERELEVSGIQVVR